MRVKMDEVPIEVRRRAARHLESFRGTPMAPGGDAARLGDEACPVYRPDVKGVAYWEIEVVGLKQTVLAGPEGKPGKSDRGFLIVSAGRHDVPLPHWSLELAPPSRTLEARVGDGKIGKLHKLDSLCYVAEDAKGKHLQHLGQFPLRLAGKPTDLKAAAGVSTVISKPAEASKSDKTPGKHAAKKSGVPERTFEPSAWGSWAEAKKGYAAEYKLHLQQLAQRAGAVWDLEDLAAKLGEGIHEGESLTVPLLKPGKASISGDGEKLVKLERLDRDPPAVVLTAGGGDQQQEIGFQLDISYEDGSTESLPFFVVPNGTPSNRQSTLPHHVARPGGDL